MLRAEKAGEGQGPETRRYVFWGDETTLNPAGYVRGIRQVLGAGQVEVVGCNEGSVAGASEQLKEVLALHPSHLFIMLGLHDTVPDPRTRVPTRSIRQFADDYRSLVRQIQKSSGAALFLLTTTAVQPERAGRQGWKEIQEQFNAEVRKLAREVRIHLVDVFAAFDRHGTGEELVEADGVTPSERGHALICETLLEYLERLPDPRA